MESREIYRDKERTWTERERERETEVGRGDTSG